MRTIMARFGLDWTAFELTWRERGALSGRGMVGEDKQGATPQSHQITWTTKSLFTSTIATTRDECFSKNC